MTEQQDTQPNTPPPEQPPPPASRPFDLGVAIAHAKQVITDPTGFYRNMPRQGGYGEPIVFGLVMAVIAGAVFGILSLIGLTGAGAAGLSAIIIFPIGMLIGSFIGAAILFVIWKLMGSPHGFETSYRSVAYAYAILPVLSVIMIIPYLGTVIRVIWSVWLMIIASVEVHGRAQNTARLVFGILGALGLVFSLSGEYAQRNLEAKMQDQAARMEQSMKSLQNLGLDEQGQVDPEKAGRAVGDFLRGMQEAAEQAERDAAENN